MKPEVQTLLDSTKIQKDPIEKGRLLYSLHKDHEVKIKDLARYLDYTQAHICNLIRLVRLPDMILDGYYGGLLKYTHLLLLSRLKDQKEMIELYETILRKSLPTSQLEDLVRERLYNISARGDKIDRSTKNKLEQLFSALGHDIKVKVIQTRVRSKLTIEMAGNAETTSGTLKKIANLQK